jgi:hypothetical protein
MGASEMSSLRSNGYLMPLDGYSTYTKAVQTQGLYSWRTTYYSGSTVYCTQMGPGVYWLAANSWSSPVYAASVYSW